MDARLRAFGRRALIVLASLVGLMMASTGGRAQEVPSEVEQEMLIKASLLTFNSANATGIYTVFHASLAKPFREEYAAEKLQQAFKPFVDNAVRIDLIAAGKPVLTEPARIDERGALLLHGYFDLAPTRRVSFTLDYVVSEAEWKLININVYVGPPKEPTAPAAP